jgi:hypothetical protein
MWHTMATVAMAMSHGPSASWAPVRSSLASFPPERPPEEGCPLAPARCARVRVIVSCTIRLVCVWSGGRVRACFKISLIA